MDITPTVERVPPVVPDILIDKAVDDQVPVEPLVDELGKMTLSGAIPVDTPTPSTPKEKDTTPSDPASPPRKLLPRETGEDIGMNSPVPLSAELVGVITRLRQMKDENEDWGRWRDVVFQGQKLNITSVESQASLSAEAKEPLPNQTKDVKEEESSEDREARLIATGLHPPPGHQEPDPDPTQWTATTETGTMYCTECYLPLHPDPDPEDLYIFLHAFRYTTECLGSFETKMPHWAQKGFTWKRKYL